MSQKDDRRWKRAAGKNASKPRRSNRRQFLKKISLATLGAVGLPCIVPSSALGADGFTAPGNRLVLGLIGMGRQMRAHHQAMLDRQDVHVAALCDVESVRLAVEEQKNNEAYAARFGKASYSSCVVYKDFRKLVARTDIDAVIIATPDHWHSIPALEAMRAGKDVYLEKPLARTIDEGKVLVETARRYGRILQVGTQQRSDRRFRLACELVRNGRIGRVHSVHVNVGGPPVECYLPREPVPDGLDWDFWLGPAPWRPYHSDIAPGLNFEGWPNWRSYRDYAGGLMTDLGAHDFDIAQWALGMDESGPTEVYPPDDRGIERLTYLYGNGTVMYRGGGAAESRRVEFIGTEGRVLVKRGSLVTDPPEVLEEPIAPGDTHLYESANHHQNWLDCIRTRNLPIADVAIGHRSATVCHVGNIAYWLNRPLQWDPVAQRFRDDEEANRLLARSMRSPWRV